MGLVNIYLTKIESKIEEEKKDLTPSQGRAYNQIINFIKGDEQYFRLSGYAGTGKSYLMAIIIEWLDLNNFKFAAASPTNKAAKNLQILCDKQGVKTEVTTVAKLLGLQTEIDKKTGKQLFLPTENDYEQFNSNESTDSQKFKRLSDYDVVIIDEYSMISKDNFEDIQEELKSSNTKVIFVGDHAQLPPIGEKVSLVATHPNIKNFATLTEVIRYDGELAKIAKKIRSNPLWDSKLYPFKTSDDGTIVKLNSNDWLEKAIDYYLSDEWEDNKDLIRIIAWRNKTVDEYNRIIRQSLYGENSENEYLEGELLITKKPVFRISQSSKKKWDIIINTSEEFLVNEDSKVEYCPQTEWDYYKVSIKKSFYLRILTPESEQQRQLELKRIADFAKAQKTPRERSHMWGKFYELDKLFDNISYAYALTCHKAQGSTIDNVFLDVADFRHCPDKQKITYTGLTRTRKTCHVTL